MGSWDWQCFPRTNHNHWVIFYLLKKMQWCICAQTSRGRTWWWGAGQRLASAGPRVWRRSPWWPGDNDENIVHTLHFKYSNGLDLILMISERAEWQEQEITHFPIICHHHITNSQQDCVNTLCAKQQQQKTPLTCLAAILEDPTTWPWSSSTSIPSDSSLCLIRPTLQMFALAEEGGEEIHLKHPKRGWQTWTVIANQKKETLNQNYDLKEFKPPAEGHTGINHSAYLLLGRGQVSVLSFWWQGSACWLFESACSVPPMKHKCAP